MRIAKKVRKPLTGSNIPSEFFPNDWPAFQPSFESILKPLLSLAMDLKNIKKTNPKDVLS